MKPIALVRKAIQDAVDTAIQNALFECGYLQTCLNCKHFTEETEVCGLYKARPPAAVIAFGCPSFVEDEEIALQFDAQPAAPAPKSVAPVRRSTGFDDMDDDIPF